MSGIDLVTVYEILGHSDIAMTVRYSHPSNERNMSAVEPLVSKQKVAVDKVLPQDYSLNLVTISESDQIEGFASH
jgi:hypothetical protein